MLIRLEDRQSDAPGNMAVDSLLLESVPSRSALFRHYTWLGHCVTFGYAQRFNAVRGAAPTHAVLCRRPTGGGIVDHANDWTYALAIGRDLPAATDIAPATYRGLHDALATVLRESKIAAGLDPGSGDATHPQPEGKPAACFEFPSPADVVLNDGSKIAGAAMRRTRSGLLIQGSIDRAALPVAFPWDRFAHNFASQVCRWLALESVEPDALGAWVSDAGLARRRQVFGGPRWTERR